MTTDNITTERTGLPVTASAARDVVRDLLGSHDRLAGPSTMLTDALLVTSELVTNAVRHGGGVASFSARLHGEDVLCITVADHSPELPRATPPARDFAPGGYGWPLVQRLCEVVTVTPSVAGKTVHAHLRLM
ncbi:ATP-binding protein [Streptomyces sp. NPDC005963]|uniref:ATP-binding protein n=1 Tax=Streptomyces sp. NPDC005963 TaxID=3156721 RepID=UPI0033D1D958